MRLCLVDDRGVAELEPLTLTRPVSSLLLGRTTLGAKLARAFGVGPGPARRCLLVRPLLANLVAQAEPQSTVNDHDWLTRGPVVVARSRWVPPPGFEGAQVAIQEVGLCDGKPAYAHVTANHVAELDPTEVENWFQQVQKRSDVQVKEVGGDWIEHPWDLIKRNRAYIIRDFEEAGPFEISNRHLARLAVVGPVNQLRVHESARIDPYVVLDTTEGPISIGAGAWIQSFTRIEGPAVIGAQSQLLRADVRGGVTIGPNCRIAGKVESSIIQGYSHKDHQGYLGHAYLGEWVNLGAFTISQGPDFDDHALQKQPPGEGLIAGDHAYIGPGSVLGTGTSIGVMSRVLPAGPWLPRKVPSFSTAHDGRITPAVSLERFFQTARAVKQQQGLEFTEVEEQFYKSLHEQARLV